MKYTMWLSLWTSSCTWISFEELETAKQSSDNDSDGFSFTDDCNDQDASINPDSEEIWYDGIDQNCDGLNDFDVDNDSFVPSGYEGALTDENPETGSLLGGDCDDDNPAIYPDAPDEFYDGIDSNCLGDNDFDKDLDGSAPSAPEYGLTTDITGIPVTDCDDEDASIYGSDPAGGFEAPTEIWYDGVDQNCDGLNDYDRDLDGHAPSDPSLNITLEDAGIPLDDCNDNDDTIYSNAEEIPYDGIDQDCQEDNDFDVDKDGHAPVDLVPPDGFTLESIGLPLDDCDDNNENRFYGNAELLSDTVNDRDCDGDPLSFVIDLSENVIFPDLDSAPRALRVDDNSNTVFVSLIAEDLELISLQGGTTATYYKVGLAIEFDKVALFDGPSSIFRWQGFTTISSSAPYSYELNEGHSIAVTDDFFFGGLGLQLIDNYNSNPPNRALRIGAQNLSNSTFGNCIFYANTAVDPFEDVDLLVDTNDILHAIGCESGPSSGKAQYLSTEAADCTDNTAPIEYSTLISDMYINKCRFQQTGLTSGLLYSQSGSTIESQSFDLTATSTQSVNFTPDTIILDDPTILGWSLDNQDSTSQLFYFDSSTVYLDDSGVSVPILENVEPNSVNVSRTPNGSTLISYVDQNGDAYIAYGDPTVQMDSFFVNTGFSATEIVAYTDDTHVLVISLGSDNVGYQLAYGAVQLTE